MTKEGLKWLLIVFAIGVLMFPLLGASATKSIIIDVSEDAYVVADLNDPDDTQGLMERNYGSLDFLKTWYFWNVVEEEGQEVEKEKIISVIYLKFDLGPIKDKKIESAMLQLYAKNVVLLTPRFVQVFLVSTEWPEAAINYNARPTWGLNALASSAVYRADYWYGWDVTDDVKKEKQPGQISFSVMLRDMDRGAEELVVFASREAEASMPRLVVTYTELGVVVSWYWWAVGGLVVLAAAALAFLGGLKLRRRQSPG